MTKPVFYDPQRKRWKRLRRVFDSAALFGVVIGILFVGGLLSMKPVPAVTLLNATHNYRAFNQRPAETREQAKLRRQGRKTERNPSDIPLNSGEGLRAAYYVEWDAASYSSLKQHIKQIDLLFPEWLHMVSPDGSLTAYTSTFPAEAYPVVDRSGVRSVDEENKVIHTITAANVDTEIFPMLNNYDQLKGEWQDIGPMLMSDAARANLVHQLDTFLAANPRYRGISMDFESIPSEAQPGYQQLIAALYADFHPRNLRLYINTPVDDDDFNLKFYAAHTDGLLLMNYDRHQAESDAGPIAPQDWFTDNLRNVLKIVPKEKIICALGSYGYDWETPLNPPKTTKKLRPGEDVIETTDLSTGEAWQEALDAGSDVDLDSDSLNPHFTYDDEDAKVRHSVWFLDAVTVDNEMRAARELGIQTFSLWRLGTEDPSLWNIWNMPIKTDPTQALAAIQPSPGLDIEGTGDIIRVTRKPRPGRREVTLDPDNPKGTYRLITDETMDDYPLSYTVEEYGYQPKKVAISFDDGPDPTWTPRILDILKRYNVSGTFFMIGEAAAENVSIMQRVYREGHEIGNHTWTHPDISEISKNSLDLQLNATERLFGAKLGVQPVYFRPPYSIDQEPDTNDEAAPVYDIQQFGYITVGNKIDTNDWDEHPRKSPQEITDSVFQQLASMQTRTWMRGSIILMHDGGGDRQPTIDALPVLIEALRAHGYQIVPVSELIGKTRDQVMPPLTRTQHWQALVDSIAFWLYDFFNHFVVMVFFVGDILMSARLLIIGLFAVIDRFHHRPHASIEEYHPRVAVLIPAYNEEKVIVRTIRSVMMSNYKNIRIIVIDDGSKDRTYDVAREAYPSDIASGRLTVLTKPNAGKAEALNYALNYTDEEVYVGIDADTVIAHDAISRLVTFFANPEIGAVAGNAKVGNRVNLWTQWQALEYITSQNFERRALDLFDVVTVVPGAIGAWRTSAVKAGGCYHSNTVAEDADLTMNLIEQGYDVIYEDRALAFTEAPINMQGLMRQRFRWSFGILQAVFKHRGAIKRNRAMGLFALPNILIFQIMFPLVSPLIDLMFLGGILHYFIDRHFHPESANFGNLYNLILFFSAFLIIDFATSALAFALERKHPASRGDYWLLFHIWIQRFTYRQVFSIVLFKTIKRAFDGKPFNWDKLEAHRQNVQIHRQDHQQLLNTKSASPRPSSHSLFAASMPLRLKSCDGTAPAPAGRSRPSCHKCCAGSS